MTKSRLCSLYAYKPIIQRSYAIPPRRANISDHTVSFYILFFLTWCLVLAARCLAIDPSFGAVFCKMFWCFRAFFSKLLTPFRKLNQKDEISKGSSLAKNKSFSVPFFVSHSSKNELTNPLDLMFEFDLIEKVELLFTDLLHDLIFFSLDMTHSLCI